MIEKVIIHNSPLPHVEEQPHENNNNIIMNHMSLTPNVPDECDREPNFHEDRNGNSMLRGNQRHQNIPSNSANPFDRIGARRQESQYYQDIPGEEVHPLINAAGSNAKAGTVVTVSNLIKLYNQDLSV